MQKKVKFKERLRTRRLRTNLTAGLAGMLALSASGQVFELRSANPLTGVRGNFTSSPTFVDIDLDGDDDLVVGAESSGGAPTARDNALLLYENVDGQWVKKEAPFENDLGIQNILDTTLVEVSPSFSDFDADGDFDAFLGFDSGGVKYYKNNEGNFEIQSGDDDPFSEIVWGEGAQKVAAGDLNGDGNTEIIITNGGAHIMYTLVDGKFVAGDLIGSDDNGYGTLNDIDGDGDLDFIVGNKYGELTLYENTAGEFAEITTNAAIANFEFSEYIRPSFGDIDGDGDLDIVLGDSGGNISFHQNEDSLYRHISYNIQDISTQGESGSNLEFVDIDGDGDQDLFIGTSSGNVQFHENINGRFSLNNAMNPFQNIDFSISSSSPSFGDIDGDGDLDCIIGDYSDPPFYYENIDGQFTAIDSIDSPFANIERGSALIPCLEDFDGDGDLDLFVGNKYGEVFYYENIDNVYQKSTLENLSDMDFGSYSSPSFGDIDDDGDRDLIVGNRDGEVAIMYNVNGKLEEGVEGTNPFDFGDLNFLDINPELGDIDQDGDVDLLVGNSNGEVYFFQNQTLSSTVTKLVLEDGVQIFPNPAQSYLNIEIPWNVNFIDVQVFTQNGQRVLSTREQNNNFTIDTKNLPSGYYSIILTGDQFLTTKKFIKID